MLTIKFPCLVENVRDVLLITRLFNVAELWCIERRNQTLVAHKSHALVRDLVAFEVDLVVGIA